MKIEMKNPLCYECCEKIDKLRKRVKGKAITVVTMGPYGTTSSISAEHFKNYLLEYLGAGSVHINLFDTFEQALEEVKRIQADFIVLPNAYGKMTNFYWDTTLDLVFSYAFKTPNYGITAMNSDYQKKESITISTCKAVEHLISEMLKELEIEENRVHIVEAYSTKKSLMMLEDNKVDLALTNDTSLIGSKAYFVTSTVNTEVLWSVFMYEPKKLEK